MKKSWERGHRRNIPYCGKCYTGRCLYSHDGRLLTPKALEKLEKEEKEKKEN